MRHGGASAQDKAAEALFHSYFAKEKAPNDPEELKEAAKAAGLDSTSVHLAAKAMLPHVSLRFKQVKISRNLQMDRIMGSDSDTICKV